MRLIDTEGRELFRGKDLISAQPQSSKARAKQFLAVQEETALLLDRDGNVVKRARLRACPVCTAIGEGVYFYEAYNAQGQIRTGMLDAAAQIVIPAETYETLAIATVQDYQIQPMDYLLASRTEKTRR